jgi:hypothetical protein
MVSDLWLAGAAGIGVAGTLGSLGVNWGLRKRGLHRWIVPYMLSAHRRRGPKPGEPIDVLIAICDHYEPKRDHASPELARKRVRQWLEDYPRLYRDFRDSDGLPPQHTFFYPEEEYEEDLLDMIVALCWHQDGNRYGEVEIHLHHDNDTAENLRATLLRFKQTLAEKHGCLSRDKETGELSYGFIHGNWALDNSRSDGRKCGVNNELDVLRETGCYADFTLPSAPSETQTAKINSIYWAQDDPERPKSHNTGLDLGVNARPDRSLLMIQGPLLLDWKRRKFGIMPKIENSCIQKSQPPDTNRIDLWLKAGVNIPTRPNWCFVKLHTHGVNEPNQDVLLGEPMIRFHQALRERANRDPLFRFHYVTAREMANLALAAAQAMECKDCSVQAARSFRYVSLR